MTEGNGVGVLKAPPVSAEGLAANGSLLASSSVTSSSCIASSVPSSVSNNGSTEPQVNGVTAALHRLSIPNKGSR